MESQSHQEIPMGPTGPDPGHGERSSLPIAPRKVRAIYNFRGANNDELCFSRGDVITLTQTPDGGWFEGTLDGVTGWFPSNYVETFDPEAAPTTPGQDHEPPIAGLKQVQLLLRDESSHLYRKMVFKDILETESVYVRDLRETLEKYLQPVHRNHVLPEKDATSALKAFSDIKSCHSNFLTTLESLQTVSFKNQTIGGTFMTFAPQIKEVHLNYCSIHSKLVNLIENHKDSVGTFMRQATRSEASNGSVLLTSSLSYSFRRLDKYPALLQELQRYTDECHPDRGDTQRAGFLYRELVSECLELRRQKEMELEVMLGNVKNWPASEGNIDEIGPIIKMGPVVVLVSPESGNEVKKDRYLVLFEKHLLLLSISNEMTSFTFESKVALTELTLPPPPETHPPTASSNVELIVPNVAGDEGISRYIFQCPSPEDAKKWSDLTSYCKNRTNLKSIGSKREQELRARANIVSESSSASSGSSLGFAKVGQEARSSYWATRSLLPHPPMRCSLTFGPEGGLKSTSSTTLSSIKSFKDQRPNSPSDDVAILQVIEGYYLSGRRKQVTCSLFEAPQVLFADEEKILVETMIGSSYGEKGEKPLVDAVNGLREEMKQMRNEIDCLADSLRKERKARKRLKAFVEKLAFEAKDN